MNNKIRVLIVDDVSETRKNVRRLLEYESDVDVVGFGRTGREAIQISQELNPDVILMDINMPDMDGIAATEAIRAKQPSVQVVILSVQSDQNYMRKAMLVGVRDYLTKPPMGDELISAIRRAGEMAKIERAKDEWVGGESAKVEIRSFLFQEKELELTRFDLETRLDLYKQSITTGKLVDTIESLVAGLAHDLRSPLNIVLSIVEITKATDRDIENTLTKLWRRCVYCKWIADNFLGISLSENTSITKLHLKSAVDQAISLLENRISDSVDIQNNITDEFYSAIDAGLFRIVMLNLLSNSLESINDKGRISISIESVGNKTAIFVEDDGTPILPKDAEKIFELGFTTKKSHCGIGLYVSKRLLQQQHGDLSFAREFHSQTKVFSFLLPNHIVQDESSSNVNFLKSKIIFLKNLVPKLQDELLSCKNQEIQGIQREEIAWQFKELTTTFSQNLRNELLAIETIALEAIRKIPSDKSELEVSFQKIMKNCAYCRLLAMNILELGENTSLKLSKVSLIEIVGNVLSLLERKMPSYLYNIEWEVDFLIPDIEADEVQIQQIFMNLLKNALDAMPNGGTLKIHFQQDDNFVQADISDTGTGITPENLKRLFQLGFTTKPKGYGIGLYTVKNILDRHKGTIEVFTNANHGATFQFRLPIKQFQDGWQA